MANLTPRLDRLERNQIHNGNFDLWQRGVSTSISSGTKTFLADRFACYRSGFTISSTQSSDVPSGTPNAKYSSSFVSTGTSTATSRKASLAYHFEGFDWSSNIGKSLYLQFWTKASVIGTYGVNLGFGGTEPTKFVQEFSITAIDTWQLIRILVPAVPTGAWQLETGLGCRLAIVASLGSDFNTPATIGQWSNSHLEGTASIAANTWGSVNTHTFKVAQVMLFAVDSSFALANVPSGVDFLRHARSFYEEYKICERYYEKSYAMTTDPGTATNTNAIRTHVLDGSEIGPAGNVFKTRKRVAPTLVIYNTQAGGTNSVSRYGLNANDASFNANHTLANVWAISEITWGMDASTLTAPQYIYFHFTADAEF